MDNNMFLGFDGQLTAMAFEDGRLRDYGESYHVYDTERNVAHKTEYDVGTRRIVLVADEEPAPLPDRIENMRNHLIAEFQWEGEDKPVLRAIIEALGEELNELQQVLYDLNKERTKERAVGKQLDGIGEIVGIGRTIDEAIAIKFFGFSGQPNVGTFDEARFRDMDEENLTSYTMVDPEYRMIIDQKIIKNTSKGTTEDTIRSLKAAFNAPLVVLEELGNANIGIGIGRKLTDNEMMLVNAANLIVRPGGVGLKYKVSYNANNYFGFLDQPYALGFDEGKFVDIF
ncbi:Protein of unknown function [Anaerovibrio lipolyticus DSM 3074]|uniref:Uncharacterized protein n=1 Tax=Anaerovibrio lipolyticus DSM 3074 TaxID=1120997 RepID=A0A1M6CLL7_9FIRM|nr:DUF2612 domain-containing protein [Anaerovibrio lipolyticus]SHI61598.1 Protein of unknown function [Anaerovibrio lipolyticus DSM 3074]